MLLPFPQQEFQISYPPLPVTPARASPLLSSPSRPSRPGRSPVLGGLRGENVAGKEPNRFPGRGQCPRCASPVPRAAGVGTAARSRPCSKPSPGAARQRDPGAARTAEGWGAPFPGLWGRFLPRGWVSPPVVSGSKTPRETMQGIVGFCSIAVSSPMQKDAVCAQHRTEPRSVPSWDHPTRVLELLQQPHVGCCPVGTPGFGVRRRGTGMGAGSRVPSACRSAFGDTPRSPSPGRGRFGKPSWTSGGPGPVGTAGCPPGVCAVPRGGRGGDGGEQLQFWQPRR